MAYRYSDDDYCDLTPNKICDNCGRCLEEEGIDTRAIRIEDIAKDVEENEFLEEELKKELDAQREERAEEHITGLISQKHWMNGKRALL